jgi:hypothetical protein
MESRNDSMSAVKVTLIAMGFFALLWLGSCALIGYGAVAVVGSAASVAGDVASEQVDRVEGRIEKHVEKARREEWLAEDVTKNGATHFENHH